MKLYSENKDYKLYNGSMLDILEVIEPNTIDSVVCDPPYELNFMGKGWDNSGIAFQEETWQRCYEVLKPGGYLLAFGGSRTFHRIACAIEDAGFEIRDTIMWLYGSGFPKSMNIGLAIDKKNGVESKVVGYQGSMMDFRDTGKKQKEISGIDKLSFGQIENSERKENPIYEAQNEWQGWGTALKPSFEPIIVARKPFKGSLVDNVIENGVGGINIDECRVPFEDTPNPATNPKYRKNAGYKLPEKGQTSNGAVTFTSSKNETNDLGRFPANTILTYDEIPSDERLRYFYCAKASKKDRDEGLDEFEEKRKAGYGYDLGYQNAGEGMFKDRTTLKKNTHPTVKPTELMQYLVRLVTPNGGTVLDPFNGSGSTGKAVMYENKERNKNYKYIGIELTEEYLPIAKARIEYVCNQINNDKQTTIFDFLGDSNE